MREYNEIGKLFTEYSEIEDKNYEFYNARIKKLIQISETIYKRNNDVRLELITLLNNWKPNYLGIQSGRIKLSKANKIKIKVGGAIFNIEMIIKEDFEKLKEDGGLLPECKYPKCQYENNDCFINR